MKDSFSEPRLALLHPKARDIFRAFIDRCETELNITLRIVQGLRTFLEQDALYAQGRTMPGNIVTQAKGGESYHNYGLATDIVPMVNGQPDWKYDFSKLVKYMPAEMVWGGTFPKKDLDHFQYTFGLNWRDLFAKYNAGELTDGYVTITGESLLSA